MAKVAITESYLEDIADAIRSKTGMSEETYRPSQMAPAIMTISGSGTEVVSVVDTTDTAGGTIRTITAVDISDTTATAEDVASGKYFYTAGGVKTAGIASMGGVSVDDLVQNLQPSGVVTLGSDVTTIKDYSLYGKPITQISGANVTGIGTYALQNTQITSITDANFPLLGVNSSYDVLLRINTLQNIELSGQKVQLRSGSFPLRDNGNLVTAKFRNAAFNVGASYRSLASNAFYGCSKLEVADVGFVNSIGNYAFQNCSKLEDIVLRNTSVVSLSASAFNSSSFANGGTGGTIYIPKSLYDHLGDGTSSDYQSATNWSTIHGYGTITWAKIEGSVYE